MQLLGGRPTQPPCTVVQPYLPGGVSVHAHLKHDSLGPAHSPSETATRSIRPFLHDRCCILPPHPSKICPLPSTSNTSFLGPRDPLPQAASRSSQKLFSPEFTVVINGRTDRTNTELDRCQQVACTVDVLRSNNTNPQFTRLTLLSTM